MTDRRLAEIATALALLALIVVVVHIMIPTPPAHRWDPFGVGTPDLRIS